MQFLKTLFWVVFAVAAVVFAMRNWTPVTVNLWGGLLIEAKLPVLIYGAFLLGLLPTYAWLRAARWRLRRRLDTHERALADIRGTAIGERAAAPYGTTGPDTPIGVVPIVSPAVEPPAQS